MLQPDTKNNERKIGFRSPISSSLIQVLPQIQVCFDNKSIDYLICL